MRSSCSARRASSVPLVRHFGLSPVLGYLGAGALLGPLGLGTFKDKAPWLYWVTVVDAQERLGLCRARRRVPAVPDRARAVLPAPRSPCAVWCSGWAALQVVLSHRGDRRHRRSAGSKPAAAVIIGPCLALSSTAIVIEVLSNQRRLSTTVGRTSFSILLAAGYGGRADPAVRLHPRQQRGQLGRDRARAGGGQCGAGHRR